MPTIRVLSLDDLYYDFDPKDRLAVSRKLRQAGAFVLNEDAKGVEAFWFHPIEHESADNALPISLDVEFSMKVEDIVLETLAEALLDVLDDCRLITVGTKFGVWIKTPYKYLWRERTKGPVTSATTE